MAKDSIDSDKVKSLMNEILAMEAEINALYVKRKQKIAELAREQIDPNITPEDLLLVAANCGDLIRKYPEPVKD